LGKGGGEQKIGAAEERQRRKSALILSPPPPPSGIGAIFAVGDDVVGFLWISSDPESIYSKASTIAYGRVREKRVQEEEAADDKDDRRDRIIMEEILTSPLTTKKNG